MKANYIKYKNKDETILRPLDQVEKTFEQLPAGFYKVKDAGGMFDFIPAFQLVHYQDNLIHFKEGVVNTICDDITTVFKPEIKSKYEEMGLNCKTSTLFFGKHGTGKTSTCHLIIREMVEKNDVIALDMTGKTLQFINRILQEIRKVQNNIIIVFCDEADNSFRENEEGWLTLLDGVDSISDFVFLGTTNFLDKIPLRIRNRRSRIRHCIEIKSLPIGVYKQYAEEKCNGWDTGKYYEVAFEAEARGLTIDEFKHALIDIHIFDRNVAQTLEEIQTYASETVDDD